MRVALLSLVALSVVAALPSDASACSPSNSQSRSRLLGIDPDGNFVQYEESWGDDADRVANGFVAYDKDGQQIASFELDGGEPTGTYFAAVLESQVSDARIIEADLIAAKRLEKPKPRRIRHVMTGAHCGSLELESKSGWLRVAEVGTLSYLYPETCKAIRVRAYEHPKVNVTFVHAAFSITGATSDESWVDHDRVHMIPNTRVEAAELTLQAERARLAQHLDEAIPMIERAIRIAPEYLPARSSLIRAYAKDHRSWDELLALLNSDIPDGRATIGAAPSKALLSTLSKTWKEAADYEEAWSWTTTSSCTFRQSFI